MISVFLLSAITAALRFEMHSTPGEGTLRCFTQYVWKDTTVAGWVDSPPSPVSNQNIDFQISETSNIYFTKPDVKDRMDFSFTAHQDAEVRFCFTAILTSGRDQ